MFYRYLFERCTINYVLLSGTDIAAARGLENTFDYTGQAD